MTACYPDMVLPLQSAARDRMECPVQLTPATYECPTHHADLTPQVRVALDEQGPPVAYADRPFRVSVTCPGNATSGAHSQVCAGRFRP